MLRLLLVDPLCAAFVARRGQTRVGPRSESRASWTACATGPLRSFWYLAGSSTSRRDRSAWLRPPPLWLPLVRLEAERLEMRRPGQCRGAPDRLARPELLALPDEPDPEAVRDRVLRRRRVDR